MTTLFSRAKTLYQTGTKLAVQFWQGSKQLRVNAQEASILINKQKLSGYKFTRKDFQLVHKSGKDMAKLIPFFIVLLILPESLPLIIYYSPTFIPSTCWSKELMESRIKKLDLLRPIIAKELVHKSESMLNGNEYRLLNQFLGIPYRAPKYINSARVQAHFDYLKVDDGYILEEGVSKLDDDELIAACFQRGIVTTDQSSSVLKIELEEWVKSKSQVGRVLERMKLLI